MSAFRVEVWIGREDNFCGETCNLSGTDGCCAPAAGTSEIPGGDTGAGICGIISGATESEGGGCDDQQRYCTGKLYVQSAGTDTILGIRR